MTKRGNTILRNKFIGSNIEEEPLIIIYGKDELSLHMVGWTCFGPAETIPVKFLLCMLGQKLVRKFI